MLSFVVGQYAVGTIGVTGTFTGLPQRKKRYLGGELFQISYTGGSGNDVVITCLPTPAPPVLTIERIPPSLVRLVWPTNEPSFNLILSSNLLATNWGAALPLPAIVGTNNVVTHTISGVENYYRLRSP
jgi:hypothetical protein